MDVSLDAEYTGADEEITYELELCTAGMLHVSSNAQGFQVADLKDTTLLQRRRIILPDHYREIFRHKKLIFMYVCVTAKGQDVVLTALCPRGPQWVPDLE